MKFGLDITQGKKYHTIYIFKTRYCISESIQHDK